MQIWQGDVYQTNEWYSGVKTAILKIRTIQKSEKTETPFWNPAKIWKKKKKTVKKIKRVKKAKFCRLAEKGHVSFSHFIKSCMNQLSSLSGA